MSLTQARLSRACAVGVNGGGMSRPPPAAAAAVQIRAAPLTRNKPALAWRGSYRSRSRKGKAGSPPQVTHLSNCAARAHRSCTEHNPSIPQSVTPSSSGVRVRPPAVSARRGDVCAVFIPVPVSVLLSHPPSLSVSVSLLCTAIGTVGGDSIKPAPSHHALGFVPNTQVEVTMSFPK